MPAPSNPKYEVKPAKNDRLGVFLKGDLVTYVDSQERAEDYIARVNKTKKEA